MIARAKRCLLASAAVALAACGDHYTTQEAYNACEDFIAAIDTTTEVAFADCVDCFERCGEECEPSGEVFVCPDDPQ